MEAYRTKYGVDRVEMTDDDSHLWVHTPGGEIIYIFQGSKGVEMTLWANRGVKYTKTTRRGTIVKIKPKDDY